MTEMAAKPTKTTAASGQSARIYVKVGRSLTVHIDLIDGDNSGEGQDRDSEDEPRDSDAGDELVYPMSKGKTYTLQKNPTLPLKNLVPEMIFLPLQKDRRIGTKHDPPRQRTETPRKALKAAVDPK
jgi:hypothetical protein